MTDTTVHVHDVYSDGLQKPIAYIESAIQKNMGSIGFSAHVPIPLENEWSMKKKDLPLYMAEMSLLKEKYQNQIQVYVGLEIDYIEGLDVWNHAQIDTLDLDYFIGAVHYIYAKDIQRYVSVDPSKDEFDWVVQKGFLGDGQALVETYYQSMESMIQQYQPPIVAHLDLLKKNNQDFCYFNEKSDFYMKCVERVLDVIAKNDCVMEVNTGGMARGYIQEPYPSKRILRAAKQRDIKVMLNSDAHSAEGLDHGYEKVIDLLKQVGFDGYYRFSSKGFLKIGV